MPLSPGPQRSSLRRALARAIAEAKGAFRDRPARTAGMCVLAMWVMFTYGLARPAADSLFLERYSAKALPNVWISVAVFAGIVTLVYNAFARRVTMARLAVGAAGLCGASLLGLLLLFNAGVDHVPFALYVWKDLYIVVMVEVFWSLANVLYPVARAKWTYGLFLVCGSFGSILGGVFVGPLGAKVGLSGGLAMVAACLFVSMGMFATFRDDKVPPAKARMSVSVLRDAWITVTKSRYLGLMVALIATVQVAVTLIDYQFNRMVEVAYPDAVLRAEFMGQLHAAVDTVALVLQALSGPILSLAGVAFVLLAIPLCVGGLFAGFVVVPKLAYLYASKVASKALDYSLFRAAKELLYIPLSHDEKTRGKAVADIFGYRVAKGASAGLLAWMTAQSVGEGPVLWVTLLLIGFWVLLASVLGRRFRAQ